jgi:hypothetical protein
VHIVDLNGTTLAQADVVSSSTGVIKVFDQIRIHALTGFMGFQTSSTKVSDSDWQILQTLV